MPKKKKKRATIKKRLFNKNRLVILNEDTFEEIFSFKLNLMNVFVTLTLGAIFLVSITTFIIAFTPLREYIPGYSSTELKKNATELALKSDSLTTVLHQNELYIKSIQKVLTGELEYAKFNKDSILANEELVVPEEDMQATAAELQLRAEVEKEEKAAKESSAKASKKKTKNTK
ncbi:peptidase [Flavobacterium sp. TMP13]|uniref:peptidase n=1 Tax=unclassified Flavobacterium TaxID=196869 RepID=UPI00076C132D|nr:peptidase [Flavobacterium sp. TAB 87]KVV13465.1 hypothetical protein AP058_02829 [Flavobacterium sp. TAB 87]